MDYPYSISYLTTFFLKCAGQGLSILHWNQVLKPVLSIYDMGDGLGEGKEGGGLKPVAWKSLRNYLFAVSFGLIAVGSVIALAGPNYLGSVSYLLAAPFILIGMMILLVRPWRYLRRLEIEMQVQRESVSMAGIRHHTYGLADSHWHHESEDGYSPRICDTCGLLMDDQGRCRRCSNGQEVRCERPR
jgi:hypothetical protein